ncbi:hypothetical protein ACLM45_12935 [Synechococcus sp. A10-1-5-9]|uniref:hypothetical protein n=1 Tax=Synechococcus sp. A10-1-5-9 TaxID=3392295 RepID=UPI0039EB0E56
MTTKAPDTANQDNLLFHRFSAFVEHNDDALTSVSELAAAHFHLYAQLRAERFTSDEAHLCLIHLCNTYADNWRDGLIPGMGGKPDG